MSGIKRGCLVIIVAALVVGCQSAAERYRWNASRPYLAPEVRRLPRSDLDQIAHLMADSWHQPVLILEKPKKEEHGDIVALTGFPNGQRREQFGFCVLEKKNGSWRIIKRAYDLEPVIIWGYPRVP